MGSLLSGQNRLFLVELPLARYEDWFARRVASTAVPHRHSPRSDTALILRVVDTFCFVYCQPSSRSRNRSEGSHNQGHLKFRGFGRTTNLRQ